MADSTVPVLFDKGMDTVSPSMLVEPGSLLNCVNYEMTSETGYRRIDGFEQYDGWIGGDIADYFFVDVTIDDPGVVASLVAGTILVDATTDYVIGVVVNYTGDTTSGVLSYAPANNRFPLILSGTELTVTIGGATQLTTTTAASRGSDSDTGSDFVTNLRDYSADLRTMVESMPSAIAGLQWHRNNLVVAVDAPKLFYEDNDSASRSEVVEGTLIGYGTVIYRVIYREEDTSGFPATMTLHLEPVGTQANNTSLRVYASNMITITYTSASATAFVLTETGTDWAYLLALDTPESNTARGQRLLTRSVTLEYTGGTDEMLSNATWSNFVTLIDVALAQILAVTVSHVSTGGDYTLGTGTGYLEVILPVSGGAYTYPQAGDTMEDFLGNPIGTVADVSWSKAAGTKRLRVSQTHYTGIFANFYGSELRAESYVATGASRSLWVRAFDDPLTNAESLAHASISSSGNSDYLDWSWGNNVAIQDSALIDMPKYVAYHAGCLALGFARGSVMLSAAGEPRNFSGVEGATEIAIGDTITGLLESVEDSLLVFGRRSIRRIVGVGDSAALRTVSPNSGCFDYTATTVAGVAVFASPSGISTLQQAQEYGDFAGSRMTNKVSNSFVPKLVSDWASPSVGGVAVAIPVRSKNQYRLWLNSGQMYSLCLSSDGPKVTISDYGRDAATTVDCAIRVPFAWTSELADSGKERVLVSWDAEIAGKQLDSDGVKRNGTVDGTRVYELDRGWGFNGVTFNHFFEMSHMFPNQSAESVGIEKIRLYGMSHGLATIDVSSSGIEEDFEQEYHTNIQDISIPRNLDNYFLAMYPMTAIVDQANWGLGIKLRFQNSLTEGLSTTEPPHLCQSILLHVRTKGATDN